ncbi:MAG: hypothetical protein WDA47_05825 [Bacilli bacterium]|jgi:type II secretory pathway pseudopilin PulG
MKLILIILIAIIIPSTSFALTTEQIEQKIADLYELVYQLQEQLRQLQERPVEVLEEIQPATTIDVIQEPSPSPVITPPPPEYKYPFPIPKPRIGGAFIIAVP